MHDQIEAEPIRLTYEDYCAMPEDGRRYEVLDGDMYMSPAPIPVHQRLALNLSIDLDGHVRSEDLGVIYIAPIDVLLDKHNIVQPDIVFISKARSSIITAKNIQGAPDLVIEVLSEGTSQRDLRDKRNIYARCGVQHYWILDPAGPSVTELVLDGKTYVVASELRAGIFKPRLFPGLEIDLKSLLE